MCLNESNPDMIYQISDVNGKNIYPDEMEETRRMNNMACTPEMDQQLVRDINEYVVKTCSDRGLLLLCLKYGCSPEEIIQRVKEINRRSVADLKARWEEFKAERLARMRGAFQPDDTAVQLV